jgi:hypothetical protein
MLFDLKSFGKDAEKPKVIFDWMELRSLLPVVLTDHIA